MMKIEGLYSCMKSDNAIRMAGLMVVLILHSSFFILHTEAQTFMDRLRQHEDGRGMVTVVQSPEIDDLVNSAQLVQNAQAPQNVQSTQGTQGNHSYQTPNSTQGGQNNQNYQNNPDSQNNQGSQNSQTGRVPANSHASPSASPQNSSSEDDQTEEQPLPDTRKKMMRGGHKVQGYRVQVFSGGNSRADRQKAESIGSVMKSHFPDQAIYVHFYSPSWKCRIGNYRSVEEARMVLEQVKQLGYSSACIVKGTITVQ